MPSAKRRAGPVLFRIIALLVCTGITIPGLFWLAASQRETRSAVELAPREGRFLGTLTGRIFIEEAGPVEGDTVLLVHGMGAWSGLWHDTIVHLADRGLHAVAIDLPPFGFSDRDPAQIYTRGRQAERLLAIVDALHARRLFVVAHSIGAAPVVEAVMRRADGIAGLVLVDPALGVTPAAATNTSPLTTIVGAVFATPALRDPLVASTLTNPWMTRTLFARLVAHPDAIDPEVVAILQRPMQRRGSTDAFAAWLAEIVLPTPDALSTRAENYARLSTPTVLIWGDRDAITPLDQARQAHELFKDSDLALLPGLGHVPQIEDPAGFLGVLDAGLAKLGATPKSAGATPSP